eukprot:3363720-Prymnesium_polylepis.2
MPTRSGIGEPPISTRIATSTCGGGGARLARRRARPKRTERSGAHPREVDGLDAEQAEDGDDDLGVLARPQVDEHRQHRLREEGHLKEQEGDGDLYGAGDEETPQQVGRAPFEALDLQLLAVPHQEEHREDKRQPKLAEEAEVGRNPPELELAHEQLKIE